MPATGRKTRGKRPGSIGADAGQFSPWVPREPHCATELEVEAGEAGRPRTGALSRARGRGSEEKMRAVEEPVPGSGQAGGIVSDHVTALTDAFHRPGASRMRQRPRRWAPFLKSTVCPGGAFPLALAVRPARRSMRIPGEKIRGRRARLFSRPVVPRSLEVLPAATSAPDDSVHSSDGG